MYQRRSQPLKPLIKQILVALMAALALTACGNDDSAQTDDGNNPTVARAQAFKARLPEMVASSGQKASAWQDAMGRVTLKHRNKVTALYKENDHQLLFANAGALTPAGQRLHQVLTRAELEGLDPTTYHVEEVTKALGTLNTEAASLAGLAGTRPSLTEDDRQTLAELLAKHPEGNDAAVLKAFEDETSGDPLGDWIGNYRKAVSKVAEKTLEMELLLADGALQYALDHAPAPPVPIRTGKVSEEPKDDPLPTQPPQISPDFAPALIKAATSNKPAEAVEGVMTDLHPDTPQYALLMKAAVHYKAIVDEGGWPTAMPKIPEPENPKDAFKYKANYKRYPKGVIEKIKRRLAGEKLYSGPINNSWDKELGEAVLRYRRNNQLHEKRWIDYEMTRAMMVPAEFRLAQIKLNLQRLRRSRVGMDGPYYVHVNLPEFRARVWDEGEKKLDFKVIVGSRRKKRDKQTRKFVFRDATPLMVDKMETVVLSPSWTVPGRIKSELARQAKDNPDFYKENGYEIRGKHIRQKPGPKNGLGLVKFLFPNKHDVYLHDTSERDLFWHSMRAFSHGCIRVYKPLDLAEYVLGREDKSWTRKSISRKAHSWVETPIELKDGPLVYLDYTTVGVDEETGDVSFFWDIYHHDIRALKAQNIRMPVDLYYP